MRSSARRDRCVADHRGREEQLGDEIAIAHRVDRVLARSRRSRGCPAAARARPDTRIPRRRRSRAASTPRRRCAARRRTRSRSSGQKCESSQCARRHRNRALHVRVRRHERRLEPVRLIDHHALQRANGGIESRRRVHRPQARRRRDLIVAAAAGVQLGRDVADLLVQQAIDQRMNILVARGRLLARERAARRRRRVRARSRSHSSSVSTPALYSAMAHAFDSWMSNGQRRKSTPIELFSASNSGAGPPAKRPPQSLCDAAGAVANAAVVMRSAASARADAASSASAGIATGAAPRAPSPDP